MSDVVRTVTSLAIMGVSLWITWKYILPHINPDFKAEEQALSIRKKRLSRLSPQRQLALKSANTHENLLLEHVVFPDDVSTSFDDIGGLTGHKNDLQTTVFLPLLHPERFRGDALVRAPLGVLFSGPPGTGKTLMAKAVARTCDAAFLEVRMSAIHSKWYGDSLKSVRAIFTLARKLAPTIVFIDEVDAFLGQRAADMHETSLQITAEFLSLWDGLTSTADSGVLVIAATNRPQDIDEGILRRFSRKFEFALPTQEERVLILRTLLKGESDLSGVNLQTIAEATKGFSGSDLAELCREAAMMAVREQHMDMVPGQQVTAGRRPLTEDDFDHALTVWDSNRVR